MKSNPEDFCDKFAVLSVAKISQNDRKDIFFG
jgi:hypothetical protein